MTYNPSGWYEGDNPGSLCHAQGKVERHGKRRKATHWDYKATRADGKQKAFRTRREAKRWVVATDA